MIWECQELANTILKNEESEKEQGLIHKSEPIDKEYLNAIMNQDQDLPPNRCLGITSCSDCVSNRKCAYCASTRACDLITNENACKHAWSVFWPSETVAHELVSTFCDLIVEEYLLHPPVNVLGQKEV
eukprot:c6128_g1_i1.p1 GENE.c6128_g1_i1~~c6128_g1_i1.p1  ORF type:complete len:128 (-),score=24.68 c6128_g1_i1:7-390(-)